MDKPRIIVIEDDHDLRQQVVEYLDLSGFAVVGVGSASELYRRMAVEAFDVLVIDIRLPGEDGLSIASHVRTHTDTAIIMVTARPAAEARPQALAAGADVFMAKPLVLPDLVAAIRGLTTRPQPLAPAPGPAVAAADGWALNRNAFTLTAPGGATIPLTATELALLGRLCAPCQAVVPRGDLLATMGYDPADPSNRNLDAALRRLRLKTRQISGLSLPLRTVHAVGYALTEDLRADGACA